MRTIWIDVEDLFDYRRHSARPSGIQRLAFEIDRALVAAGAAVRFLRHRQGASGFVEIAWDDVVALFADLTEAPVRPQEAAPSGWLHRLARPLLSRLPDALHAPLSRAVWHQRQSLLAMRQCLGAPWQRPARTRPPRPPDAPGAALVIRRGDVLLVLGSPWFHTGYAALLRAVTAGGGRVGVLLYDIIPLRRPEWCDRTLVRLFAGWFVSVLPEAQLVFAISHATAADVRAYCRAAAIRIPDRITVLPIGSGLPAVPGGTAALPEPGSYALFVSTVEARKNHALLVRVWRRLLDELPPDQVPRLVFAGRVGWLVADLMQQLQNTDFLGGKIVLIENATDADLASLYQGCLFTLFPSFYEGWGLPVSESLAFGKPCIIADNSSLPEAGGDLARYFDADDVGSAYRVIRETLSDPAGRAAWERRVQRDFKPIPWAATAQALLAAIDAAVA